MIKGNYTVMKSEVRIKDVDANFGHRTFDFDFEEFTGDN